MVCQNFLQVQQQITHLLDNTLGQYIIYFLLFLHNAGKHEQRSQLFTTFMAGLRQDMNRDVALLKMEHFLEIIALKKALT